MRRNKTSGTIFANFRFKGKLFRHSLETEDKTVARNKLAEFRRDLDAGPITNAENTTVARASVNFLQSLATKSSSVQVRSKGHMKTFCAEFGEKNPRRIKPMEIQEWLQELREQREFGEDCYNKYVETFRNFYGFLIKNSFAQDNPLDEFDFLKGKATRKYTPTTSEVEALLKHIRTKTFFPEKQETLDFIEFMVLTGQGKAEAIHAQWMDVLWDARKINFYRQKTRAIAHTMPLFPALESFLKRRFKDSTKKPSEPIFKIKSCKRALGSACEKLGYPRLGHHSFRRYFITQRLMEGIPPNIVAKWVGHRTSEMVMEIYSSIPNTYEVSFAEKIPAIQVKDG
jgi:integrase